MTPATPTLHNTNPIAAKVKTFAQALPAMIAIVALLATVYGCQEEQKTPTASQTRVVVENGEEMDTTTGWATPANQSQPAASSRTPYGSPAAPPPGVSVRPRTELFAEPSPQPTRHTARSQPTGHHQHPPRSQPSTPRPSRIIATKTPEHASPSRQPARPTAPTEPANTSAAIVTIQTNPDGTTTTTTTTNSTSTPTPTQTSTQPTGNPAAQQTTQQTAQQPETTVSTQPHSPTITSKPTTTTNQPASANNQPTTTAATPPSKPTTTTPTATTAATAPTTTNTPTQPTDSPKPSQPANTAGEPQHQPHQPADQTQVATLKDDSRLRVEVSTTGPSSLDGIEETTQPKVKLTTTMGDIVIQLDAEKAPLSVQNYIRYVVDGFYNNTIFHRVIDNFMIQGGGFTPDMQRKPVRQPVPNESQNGLSNRRGTVAMARTSHPDSATSQFFINVVDNHRLDYPNYGGYTVFGRVVQGMDTVDRIRAVQTTQRSGMQNVPAQPVIITNASLVE